MVTIEITGADNYITSATVLGHTLTLVKRSPTGTFTQDLILPYSHDFVYFFIMSNILVNSSFCLVRDSMKFLLSLINKS